MSRLFRSGSRLISAASSRSAFVPTPSLCNAAIQGQVIAKRNLLQRPGIPEGIKEFYFNLQGFNQYGLLHDDVLHETEIVTKAISRLAPQIQDERAFRISRAMQCCVTKGVLPKDQWSTWQDHKERGTYLQAYIDEIVKEEAEQQAWDKN